MTKNTKILSQIDQKLQLFLDNKISLTDYLTYERMPIMQNVVFALYKQLDYKTIVSEIGDIYQKLDYVDSLMKLLEIDTRRYILYDFLEFIDWDTDMLKSVTYIEANDLLEAFKEQYKYSRNIVNAFKFVHHFIGLSEKDKLSLICCYYISNINYIQKIHMIGSFETSVLQNALNYYLATHKRISCPDLTYNELANKWSRFITFVTVSGWKNKTSFRKVLCTYTVDDFVQLIVQYINTTKVKNDFVKNSRNTHPGKKHFANVLSLIRSMHDVDIMSRKEILALNFNRDIEKYILNKKIPKIEHELITENEFSQLLDVTKDNPLNSLFITILKEIALRSSALARCTYSTFINNDYTVRKTSRILEKGAKFRTLLFSELCQYKVMKLMEFNKNNNIPYTLDDYMFVSTTTKYKSHQIRDRLKKIMKCTHIPKSKHYIHIFRHSLVTNMIDKGIKSEVVSKYIGHSRIDTTIENYWVVNMDKIFEEINNPFKNNIVDQQNEIAIEKQELEKVWDKVCNCLKLSRSLYLMVQSATNLDSLKDTVISFIPDLEQLEKAIVCSSTTSDNTLE